MARRTWNGCSDVGNNCQSELVETTLQACDVIARAQTIAIVPNSSVELRKEHMLPEQKFRTERDSSAGPVSRYPIKTVVSYG